VFFSVSMEITVFMLGESRKISMDEGATGEIGRATAA